MAIVPTEGFGRNRILAWPSTKLGRRASAAAAFVVVWFVCLGALASVEASDWGWLARGILIVAGLGGVAAGIAAGVGAVVAVVRGERSLVLVAPLGIGALWVLFLVGEFLFPH